MNSYNLILEKSFLFSFAITSNIPVLTTRHNTLLTFASVCLTAVHLQMGISVVDSQSWVDSCLHAAAAHPEKLSSPEELATTWQHHTQNKTVKVTGSPSVMLERECVCVCVRAHVWRKLFKCRLLLCGDAASLHASRFDSSSGRLIGPKERPAAPVLQHRSCPWCCSVSAVCVCGC